VERGDASRRRPGGGDEIQAPRPARTRLIPGGAALLLASGLGLWAALATDRQRWLPAVFAGAALILLATAIVSRRAAPIAWSVALLGGAYAVRLALDGGGVDTRAPLEAAGLLLVAELAYDALERGLVRTPPELASQRVAVLTGLAAGAIVLGAGVLAVAAIPLGGGVGLTALGVAAATILFAVLARLSRRGPR
jgi:hypothetical protein